MILVLAGTKKAKEIIKFLRERRGDVLASVVTDHGNEMLEDQEVEVLQGKMDKVELEQCLEEKRVNTVLDATHPFAVRASQNAMEACKSKQVTYFRAERDEVSYDAKRYGNFVTKVDSFREAADESSKYERVLLTIGSGKLDVFTERVEKWRDRLVTRILPDEKFVARARRLGFEPGNIIAMKGPFSKELNEVLIRDYEVDVLVTKASGKSGGVEAKLDAARAEEITAIVIKRPELDFPRKFSGLEELNRLLDSGKL